MVIRLNLLAGLSCVVIHMTTSPNL